jgi:hypothetical protein
MVRWINVLMIRGKERILPVALQRIRVLISSTGIASAHAVLSLRRGGKSKTFHRSMCPLLPSGPTELKKLEDRRDWDLE